MRKGSRTNASRFSGYRFCFEQGNGTDASEQPPIPLWLVATAAGKPLLRLWKGRYAATRYLSDNLGAVQMSVRFSRRTHSWLTSCNRLKA